MRSTIIKEITKKGLDTYFQVRQYNAMFWPSLFPIKDVLRLDYVTLIGEQNGMVAADVIAYDASAPLKTRQVVSKLSGDIPKISLKRKMTETDMNEYYMLSNMSNPNEKQILDLIYNDVDFVVEGVNARMEWLALQAASKTKIVLSSTNNNGLVTEEAIDFMMPSVNKTGVAVKWSASSSTTTPITDVKKVVKKARDKGIKLSKMLMHPDAYDYFTASTETQNFLKSFYNIANSAVVPFQNVEAINTALSKSNLPVIVIIDQSIGIEGKNGVISYSNPWDSKYVLFIPDAPLGKMLNGPIAEENFPPEGVLQSKSGNILVTKYSDVDPVAEFTKGEANSFPSWNTVNLCFSLNVDHVTDWE